jgi:hypothetical protein
MRALDSVTLEQLLTLLKRAQLQTRQCKSRYKGIRLLKNGAWQVRLRVANKERCQAFNDEDEAAKTHDHWVLQHAGR